AKQILQSGPSANHEDLPISGHPQFLDVAWDILVDSTAEGPLPAQGPTTLTPYYASVRHRLRFATGDLGEEAWAVRQFVRNTSTEFVVAQSFSKNFGLYGERIGALHVIQSPRLVETVLRDETLKQQWLCDIAQKSNRMRSMRKRLVEGLKALKTSGSIADWHVLHTSSKPGIGFGFAGEKPRVYTAFTADFIQRMYVATFAQLIPIYGSQMTLVTEHNVDHVVKSSHKVIIGAFVLGHPSKDAAYNGR
ncbi:unnamed protein product, partial [Clonostachys rosea]